MEPITLSHTDEISPDHETGPAILKKLHAVMGDVSYIQKTGSNPRYGGKKYLTELAAKVVFHESFVKHGILPQFEFFDSQTKEHAPTSKGVRQFLTKIAVTYTFWDIETGQCLRGSLVGHGICTEDKGVYKAMTNAIKYALTSQFLVPTGDDAEVPSEDEKSGASAARPIPALSPNPIMVSQPTMPGATNGAPATAPQAVATAHGGQASQCISEKQVTRYWGKFYSAKKEDRWTDDQRVAHLRGFGYEEPDQIPWGDVYDKICADLDAVPPSYDAAGVPTANSELPPGVGIQQRAPAHDPPELTDDDIPF